MAVMEIKATFAYRTAQRPLRSLLHLCKSPAKSRAGSLSYRLFRCKKLATGQLRDQSHSSRPIDRRGQRALGVSHTAQIIL